MKLNKNNLKNINKKNCVVIWYKSIYKWNSLWLLEANLVETQKIIFVK